MESSLSRMRRWRHEPGLVWLVSLVNAIRYSFLLRHPGIISVLLLIPTKRKFRVILSLGHEGIQDNSSNT